MNKIDSSLSELLNMLVTIESTLKGSRGTILTVDQAFSKRKSSWKKKKPAKKQKIGSKPKKQALKKTNDNEKYFHCIIEGHWKRNYPAYLATLKIKKIDTPSEGTFKLFVIETNLTILSSSS